MPNWMGDFLLALSVVERKVAAQGERPTLLAPQWLAPLATLLTDLPVISYKRDSGKQWRTTRREVTERRFDTIYLLPYSFSSAWFAFRAGIRNRRGISRDGRGMLLSQRLQRSVRDYSQHLTKEYCAVLDVDYQEPQLWKAPVFRRSEKHRGCIVLCPGATYGPAKRWPYFNDLVQLLSGKRIVLLGKTGDAAGIESPAQHSASIEDLTGRTTLPQAAAIIAAAGSVIANDSGLMHLAGFLGTPVAGIFGSTSPDWTHPLGKRSAAVYDRQPCSPCFERTCRFGHYTCLRSIAAPQVMERLTEVTA
jgi:heptosyltransferase-2